MCFLYQRPQMVLVILWITLSTSQGDTKNSTRRIRCEDSNTLEEFFSYIPNEKVYERKDVFVIENCRPPRNSYKEFLTQIGINATTLTKLVLHDLGGRETTPLRAEHFTGLNLKELSIFYLAPYRKPQPELNFLEPLTSLTGLYVLHMNMPPLPEGNRIEDAELFDAKSLGSLGDCQHLQNLTLWRWEVTEDRWLSSCPLLSSLKITHIPERDLVRVLQDTNTIKHLSVNKCSFITNNLPDDFFKYLKNLLSLNLDENQLTDQDIEVSTPNLRVLEMRDNSLMIGAYLVKTFWKLPELVKINLSRNTQFEMCNEVGHLIGHSRLKELILDETSTSSLACLAVNGLPELQYLSLKQNKIVFFMFKEILLSKRHLQVDLQGNSVEQIVITKEDYAKIVKLHPNMLGTITFLGLTGLDCDCHHAFFAQTLRKNLVEAKGVRCGFGFDKEVIKTYPVLLECTKFDCDSCICRRTWIDNSSLAYCDRNVSTIPKVEGLTKIIAPNNRINEIRRSDISDTLTYMDLRNNRIWYVDDDVARALFSTNRRHMLLSGNPILCNCNNLVFIQTIQEHYDQVEDYNIVKCEDGTLVSQVVTDNLCPDSEQKILVKTLAPSGTVVLMILFAGIVFYRYGRAIRIFLFARGLCLCCIQEEDAEKTYDAFVSFCHADEELVSQHFVPELEARGFQICVHYRDWLPGEMIPTQIVHSVEVSRRTVVVLSRSFIASIWGMLEFRTALVRTLAEGISRLIVIVLDDVTEMPDQNPDLRSYLRTNTYLRWGDPWFWDKLCYAMPRPRPRPGPGPGPGWKHDGSDRTPDIRVGTLGNTNVIYDTSDDLHISEEIPLHSYRTLEINQ